MFKITNLSKVTFVFLLTFLMSGCFNNSEPNQQIKGLKSQLLELRAPSEYLSLHLNLVIGFELIEQGQKDSDQAKIEEGMEKINSLRIKYSDILE